jgi:hypothetical protein
MSTSSKTEESLGCRFPCFLDKKRRPRQINLGKEAKKSFKLPTPPKKRNLPALDCLFPGPNVQISPEPSEKDPWFLNLTSEAS